VTTYDGFHRNIEKNSSIASLFEKVEVGSISAKDTLMIMTSLIPAIEQRNKIFVSYLAIRDIVSLTDRYFSSLPFPEKALDILDEVVIYVSNLKEEKIVLPKHVSKIIAQKAEVPVGEMDKKERDILLNLEVLIHQRIVNQEEAVKNVATALRRARADITVRKGPMGAFLFLGPTGVGKTETSKALAEFYFGSEKKMIRLDMSEFQEIRDIPRLIGSREELGLLTNPVKETPFSIVLLDEFEKAHPNILNLFLQIFDEGYITDGLGKKIDFKNTILIATSNAGYQIILEALKDQRDWQEVKAVLLDNLFKEGVFRPELINRFDAAVVFKPLSKDNLLDIAGLLLNKLSKNLQEKGIEFVITEELKEKVAELGYNPMFGAREMRRVIQEKVENSVASAILSGELARGSRIEINPVDFKLIVNNN
jgi:ATP-dependent Clp protease ATP-binding subunit ClpC